MAQVIVTWNKEDGSDAYIIQNNDGSPKLFASDAEMMAWCDDNFTELGDYQKIVDLST